MFSCFIRGTFLKEVCNIPAFSSKMTLDFLFWTIGPICCYIFSPWKPPKKSATNTPTQREALEVHPLGRANDPPRHALEEMNGYRISQLTDVCWFWKKHVKLANSGVVSTLSTSQFLPKKEKKRPPGIDNVPWNRFKLFGSTFLNNLSWGPTFDGMLVSCINLKGLASHPESEDVRITKTKIGRQKMWPTTWQWEKIHVV